MGEVKKFTLEERLKLSVLLKTNISVGNISKILERSPSGLSYEINKNGGRLNYDPKQADERIKIKKNNSFSSRIQNLEMQMEILIDQIKELKNDSKNH